MQWKDGNIEVPLFPLRHRARRKVNCMGDKSTKVLGYVAVVPGTINVLCDGDSCIVAGSEKLMRDYIASFCRARTAEYHVRKARYGHVLQSMKLGAAYSFDAESFSRFSPLAREDGIEPVDYTPANRGRPDGPAIFLMRVNWVPIREPSC